MAEPDLPRGYLMAVRFERGVYPERPSLSLVLRPSAESAEGQREVTFEGVCDLRVRDLDTLHHCVWVARDVRDRQWDGVNYAVADSEDEVIAFHCLGWIVSP